MTAGIVSVEDPWLSEDQVHNLTGYLRPADQIRWLQENRIKHYVNAKGRVRIPIDAIATKLPQTKPKSEPDFSKVRRAG